MLWPAGRVTIPSTLAYFCYVLIGSGVPSRAATVSLRNADRLTGEIQKLEGKHLVLKTAYAGIIEIEWSEVQSINSDEVLELSMQNGMIVTGTVHAAEAGMEISSSPDIPISAHNIKAISKPGPDQTFRNRVSGAIELGYSLTRGNSPLSQSAVTANAEYHSTRVRVQADLSSLFSKQAPAESASAHSLSTRLDYHLTPHAFLFTLGGLERDERELLNLRTSLGAGLGWQIADSPTTQISVIGGVNFVDESYQRQDASGSGRREPGGEALIGFSADKLEFGRLSFFSKTSVYPSLLERGRLRIVASSGVRLPLVGHLTWSLRFFEKFDSRPLLPVKKNDYGTISSFGFVF
jgi:putative salt-induced outer membrane protein YdiY